MNGFEVVAALISIAKAIADALINGEPERVEEILPGELRTTIVKRAKDLEADAKFGPRS